jgi:hypothetical protein
MQSSHRLVIGAFVLLVVTLVLVVALPMTDSSRRRSKPHGSASASGCY